MARIAWLTTFVLLLVGSALLLVSGYLGYCLVLLAVALAALINLV